MSLEKEVEKTGKEDYKLIKAARQDAVYVDILASSKYQAQPSEPAQPPENLQEQHEIDTLAPPLPPPGSQENVYESISSEKQQHEGGEIDTESARKRKVAVFSATAIILILTIMGIIFTTPGVFTGYATATREVQQAIDYNQAFSQNAETQLELSNIIGLKISGILEGTSATVKLRINGTEYLVAEIINPDTGNLITGEATEEGTEEKIQYTISTDKTTYTLGETATITISPDTENKSLYISHGEQTQKLDSNVYTPIELGEYQAIALITLEKDILRIETNFTVANETNGTEQEAPEEPIEEEPTQTTSYEFTGLCTETCTLQETSNPVLIIETDPDTTLTITQIITTQERENNEPVQTQNMPDINLIPGQVATLDLNQYFTDPEDDTVQYDINQIAEINATISQSTLTITSATPGTYTAYIYATDGDKLVTSNTFQVIVSEPEESPQGGEVPVVPGEANLSNETVEGSVTYLTDCNDPNPNLRPPECIQGNEEQYFKNTPIYLQNLDRAIVGRVTAFGNLIIRGRLIENSQEKPGMRDFRISYFINDGETEVTAAWVDTQTGDLHLSGKVFEEQFSILPSSQDAFLIQNKKGTNLGFIDRHTGNLYLRGNLIQERTEQDIIE